jgi:hypothetical protein
VFTYVNTTVPSLLPHARRAHVVALQAPKEILHNFSLV